jgi:two-component system chemotaxis response regulator CheB
MITSKIRVLVVDDSALMRHIITDILRQDPEMDVIGTAKDGREAIKKAQELNPDVITLDIEMPVMDGMSCLDNLMKQGAYGVVVVSGVSQQRADATIRALEHGAFDFISKPSNVFDLSSEAKKEEILSKVKLAYRTLKKAESLKGIKIQKGVTSQHEAGQATELKYIVGLGISTGGPRALSTILPEFPGNLPAAIVIVQHMPPGFTKSLAVRLNETSRLHVKEAEDNEEIKAGTAYVAPGDNHIIFQQEGMVVRIKLLKTPPVGGFRPSADVMLTSLSDVHTYSTMGVIMTGMGSDGSRGLMELKKKRNSIIIAQDESTSIVFGMPRSAIELGIVDKTVPLQEIPACIMNFMGVQR